MSESSGRLLPADAERGALAGRPAREPLDGLLAVVAAHVAGAEPSDDLTMLAFDYLGS